MKMKLHFVLLFTMLFASTSCLNQGKAPKIPGVDGPKLNIMDGKILLSVGLENIDLQGGATLPLPKLDRSSVTLAPRLEGGTLIQVALDPKDIESDEFRVVPHETLPDGRPFPFLVGGTLPALAIQVPKAFDTTFYASNKVFGFFLPIKLPDEFNVSIHYRLKINGKNVGIVSLIHPGAEGEGAGVILLLTMDEIRNNDDFKKLLKLSKKRKYRKKVF
jgi:hypothetical protein